MGSENMRALVRAGLTENESKVYLEVLRVGSTTTGPLIKNLGMHRAAVYDTLDMLIEKGLVRFVIKSNKKHFEAHDPERLLDYMENKKEEIEKRSRSLKRNIKKLRKLRSSSLRQQEAYIYKGKSGLKSVMEDILKEGKQWLVFGARGQFVNVLPHYYKPFHKKRIKLDIPMRIIRSEKFRSEERKMHMELRKVRYVPDEYTTMSTTFIYGKKLAIIVWSTDSMAFVVRSRTVADSYRKYFEVLWKAAKS